MVASGDEAFVSYAQQGEDIRLRRALGALATGHYLDVGAMDPVEDSVTYALSRRGWSGIAVEPLTEYAESWRAERPGDRLVSACAGRAVGRTVLTVRRGTGRSSVDAAIDVTAASDGNERRDVPAVTLDHVLAQTPLEPLHLVVIDVEGAEADVLAGFDLSRWAPWVLVVEATRPGTPIDSTAPWEGGVLAAGYVEAAFDGLNKYYVAPDHLDLAPPLALPPNVFDRAVTLHEQRRLAEIARLETLQVELAAGLESANREQVVRARTADLRLRQVSAAARAARAAADAEIRALRADLAGEQARVVELTGQQWLITGSLSWRITEPLRAGSAGLRGLRSSAAVRPRAAARRLAYGTVTRTQAWAVANPRRHELAFRWGSRVPLLRRAAARARLSGGPSHIGALLRDADSGTRDAAPWRAVLLADLDRRTASSP